MRVPFLHFRTLLAAALMFGFGPGGAALGAGSKQVQIIDPNFNMVAFTMTIPAGWNFQGTVLLSPGCGSDLSLVAYRVWSDDMRYGVQRMPGVSWFTENDAKAAASQKCKTMEAMTADEYGKMVLPVLRPGYKLLSVNTAPQAASMADSTAKMEAALAANADRLHLPHPRYSSDAKELRVEYMLGNQPEEEFLQVMEQVSETPTSAIVSRPGQVLRTAWVMKRKTDAWIVAERAPKGQLDAARAQLEAIRTSLKESPEWDKKVAEWLQDRSNAVIRQGWAITNASLKLSAERYAALRAKGEAFNDNMRAQGDKRLAEAAELRDARGRRTADKVDYLLDQQYYVNPSNGRTSTISTTYTNNWQNGMGDKVLTNIQGYDPNGEVPGNWTQLQPIKH
jgi:hypothetical protein